ncbi:uncharacterized protein LOC109406988 [Aedes albopictus]|uniref:Secreted protein n=1 Tax=Aedes albopictus TaxID=7160 RepID=A0ABM2A499_AEDAL|nr:uncharacterized protein LOC109426326 [Aedes albopictus]
MSSSPFHHFAFNHGTRKIAPLKVRNPSISPSQIMPSPSGVPFNIADMPWSYSGKPGQLMEFNAVIRPSPILQGPLHHSLPYPEMRKRKTEPDVVPIPSKQFFTDESMAIHMNNLHLSSEYTSHNIETTTISASEDETLRSLSVSGSPSSLDDDMSLGEAGGPSTSTTSSSHVYMSPQELEERLKKAQRISVCEEVRKLDNRTEILPQVLLERIEKPCTALVLWQPPPVLEKILTKVSDALKEREEQETKQQESSRRSNEVAMGDEEETLPDLPDYDDDLDFEENNNNVASVSDMNSMDVEM